MLRDARLRRAPQHEVGDRRSHKRDVMTEGAAGEPKVRRWTSQRWAHDNALRSVGIDWDQPRSSDLNAACGIEGGADFAAIRERVRKYADIEPAFANTARRREAKARAAEDDGAPVTARDNYFMA